MSPETTLSPAGHGTAGPAVLDHVAVAVERWADAWPRYAVDLGGSWNSGGLNIGFGPAQLRFANGARVEVLQPWQPESNPFLRRFLDTNGPGPHHLTFKVADLPAALDAVRAGGFDPIGVDLSDPTWQEAFLHPRQATGVVVQLAQAAADWTAPAPEGFPAHRRHPPAALDHVTHVVADLDGALVLFRDLLGGSVERSGDAGPGLGSVDLRWSGPLGLRLVGPAGEPGTGTRADDGLATHLAGRPGRVHHLHFTLDDPGDVADAAAADGLARADLLGVDAEGAWVVQPQDNLGARLVLAGAG